MWPAGLEFDTCDLGEDATAFLWLCSSNSKLRPSSRDSCAPLYFFYFPLQLYAGAILELVQTSICYLMPKMFKGLQIKYVRGSDPILKLLDDNGNIAEELSITKWNTDSVEEFLSEKLDRI
uniref:Selenoprotein F n=1 Tax=Xiphophorus couchianus TaxID=32473 RepID=A0A3B5LE25_9TELE